MVLTEVSGATSLRNSDKGRRHALLDSLTRWRWVLVLIIRYLLDMGRFLISLLFGTGCRNLEQYSWDDLSSFQYQKKTDIFLSRQYFALSQTL